MIVHGKVHTAQAVWRLSVKRLKSSGMGTQGQHNAKSVSTRDCAPNLREFLPCEGGGKERQVEGTNSEIGGRGTARVGTCLARVGTYQKSPFEDKRPKWRKRTHGGREMPFRWFSRALSRFSRGLAQNVWERICRAGRFRDSTGGLHGTCRNVCLWGGVSTFKRKGCTGRVRTYRFYLSFSFFTAGLHGTCRNVCFWRDVSTFERKGCTERVGTYHFVIDSFKM